MRRIAISPRSAAFPTRNSSPTPLPLRQRRQADRSNFSMSRSGASKFAALSIAAALATISLKTLAWWLTDSVGLEGTLILIAAVGIGFVSVERLITPRPLEHVGAGLVVSAAASLINYMVARRLYEA